MLHYTISPLSVFHSQFLSLDERAFWWINDHHSDWLDWVMWTFSQGWSWAVVILAVLFFVTLRKDRSSWLWFLIGIALCFLLADQISNNVIKDGVQRLRPCHALENVRMFHTGKGGLYGFVSSHAANGFAVAMFISLLYGGRRKQPLSPLKRESFWKSLGSGFRSPWIAPLMMSWATILSYSRPYLGKHYPGDIICGAILGLGIGATVYFVISKIRLLIASKSSK